MTERRAVPADPQGSPLNARPRRRGTCRAGPAGHATPAVERPDRRQAGGRAGVPARRDRRGTASPLARPWCADEKLRFLDALREGADVEAAARRCGRTRAGAFAERLRDPAFAEAWDEALGSELDVLETRLIARALARTGGESSDERAERLALQLLSRHRARAAQQAAERPAPAAEASGPADPAALRRELDQLIERVAARIAEAEARVAQGPDQAG
ncbi:MAG: hypothetical protein NZM40_08045 [Sphingomonadaceae bacterium]|nr:hypothetical protein [Sphingomonadaceae bacterium]MDW8414583.1 hypothetical protein [Thermaurantiacus sp.]